MKVYRISGNCIAGGYHDSVTELEVEKETKKLIVIADKKSAVRQLNKDTLDVYRTSDTRRLVTVFTVNPDNVPIHLKEIRMRLQDTLDIERTRANESLSRKIQHETNHIADDWRSFVGRNVENES